MTEPSKGERTRAKLVAATASLMQRQGYHATGLAEIVDHSGAPRGSLYFYFPGGKEELAKAALGEAGAEWRRRIEAVVADAPDIGAAVEAVCRLLANDLAASDFQHGCPVAAVALESAGEPVRQIIEAHYAEWEHAIIEFSVARGSIDREAAKPLATFVLASIEGAMLLAKVHRSREPLLRVGAMLRAMAAMTAPERPRGKRRKPRRRKADGEAAKS
jgi:TetR/AcrR family transcriptional repressor of lmrAB and yxaGH operons